MPSVKKIEVKEELAVLKKHHKTAAPHLKARLQMLILCVQKALYSKYKLAEALGVGANTIHEWKTTYV